MNGARWSTVLPGMIAAVIAGYLLLVYLTQRSVLFPAPPAGATGIEPEHFGGERVWLPTPWGAVEAWFLPALTAASDRGPLLLFAHGNAELIDDWPAEFEEPRRWGVSVLLVEYPGYGRSAGRPSERSIAAALVAAFDWAIAQEFVDPGRIVGYGRSVGGGAVGSLARERALAALVLESTFASVAMMARRFGVPRLLVRDRFDNVEVVRSYPGPILLLHGARDDVIPPLHAELLHAAAPRSELELLPCGHNDCERPWAAVKGFLAREGLL